jgi:hypothetical protein
MAECIVTSTETRSRRYERNEYCLSEKARRAILSMSDSALTKRIGETHITTREIETQRQAFIHRFGNEFGQPHITNPNHKERYTR